MIAQQVIEEEIVQIVRADGLFCFLCDHAFAGRRKQFRRDRRITDIQQGIRQRRVSLFALFLCVAFHHVADERLRDGGVDGIHRHMIAVVCAPAQRQLAEVAGAQDDRIVLVGQVHQDLGALPRLCVFIGDVMDVRIVADVLEMLADRIMDRHLHAGDVKQVHQRSGIGVGAGRRAEARHRDSDDVFRGQAVHPERLGRDDERQGGV